MVLVYSCPDWFLPTVHVVSTQLHTHTHPCTHTHVHKHAHTHTCTHNTHTHTHTCTHTHTHTHTHTSTHTHTHTHVHTRTHTHTHTHVHTHICTHTHTHTHTLTSIVAQISESMSDNCCLSAPVTVDYKNERSQKKYEKCNACTYIQLHNFDQTLQHCHCGFLHNTIAVLHQQ